MNYEKILDRLKCFDYYLDATAVSSSPKLKHVKSFEKIIGSFSRTSRLILELYYERGQPITEIKWNTGKSEGEIESIIRDVEFYFNYRPTQLFVKLGDSDFYRWVSVLNKQLGGNTSPEIYDMPAVILYDDDRCLKGSVDSDTGAEIMVLSEIVSMVKSGELDLSVVRLMSLNLDRLNVMKNLHQKAVITARNALHGYTIQTEYDQIMFQVSNLARVMGYRETHLAGLLLSMAFLQHLEKDNHDIYLQQLKEEPFRTWIDEGVEYWDKFDNTALANMSCYIVPGLLSALNFTNQDVPKTCQVSAHCNKYYANDVKTRMKVAEVLLLHGAAPPVFIHPYQFSVDIGESPEEKQKRDAKDTIGSILTKRNRA